MKHQYFGDVNDYRKYGLLRCLAEATRFPVGILWLLTEEDGRTDGEFRSYLRDPARWRHHDPELFDRLRQLLIPGTTRTVVHARNWSLIPGGKYFNHVFTDSASDRRAAFMSALLNLSQCPLIFLDPDNGIEVKSTRYGGKRSSKYVFMSELEELFGRGHSMLIYQHYPRISRKVFERQIADRLTSRLNGATVLALSSAHVVFLLVLRPEHSIHSDSIAELVQRRWSGQIFITRATL